LVPPGNNLGTRDHFASVVHLKRIDLRPPQTHDTKPLSLLTPDHPCARPSFAVVIVVVVVAVVVAAAVLCVCFLTLRYLIFSLIKETPLWNSLLRISAVVLRDML